MNADSPEAMRAEIELTRARMSATLDEIEDVLVEKTDKVRETVDVKAKVRESPFRSVGIAVGAGLALGLLTGGRKKEGDPRAEMLWRERAERIRDIARKQEEEIDDLHQALREVEEEASAALAYEEIDEDEELFYDDDALYDDEPLVGEPSRAARVRESVRAQAEVAEDRARDYLGQLDELLRDRAEAMDDQMRRYAKKVDKKFRRLRR